MAFLANFASGSLLPWGLLLLYFVQSFLQSFPITAYGDWLFNEIHMSPATTNVYYALTFFPWNLKPVYALVSDNFPIFGYRRKYYIVLCEIGAALSVLATGLFVRSVAGAFVVKMIDSSCEAFTQMMLGVVLVDVASGNHEKSGNVQAWANAAKNTASIVALVVGIPIYANKSISSREIICWSSVIPVMGILISLYLLHEPRVSLLPRSSAHPTNPQTCTYLVHRKWRGFVAACKRIMSEQRAYVPVMIFFFLSSALPSGGSVWYQYTYSLLNDQKECLQYASLAVCTFCTIESFVTSFAGEFALLQLLIVATYFCPTTATDGNGLTYALYLSFMDFGGVVSSFVSAIVINALGITEDPTTFVVNWSNLSWLVVIGAVCKLAILAFLCVLPTQVNVPDDEEDHQMQPLLPRAGSADVSP
ncbi:hypothetical protein DYB32_008926 [Aphanomyces invadans]|uniref:Folate/biopterin transporter n=1 Tax=Aphanomyces invadans TaxID=157072 RepID=A0A418AJS9_9STRA|nr:hypothetical protein DYB32_008926 [Aphanomyces invadans]